MAETRHEKIQTLIGVLVPAAWEDDRVIYVALNATDDKAYLIENGEKFIDLLQQCIEARGKVTRPKKVFRRINIKRFRILESI
jgi:hypothetical protein